MSKIMYSLDDNREVEVSSYFESNGEKYALCYLGKGDRGCSIIGARKIDRLVESEPEELIVESDEWNEV